MPNPPQYVVIKNYSTKGLKITSENGIDLQAKGYGTSFFVSIENIDTLSFINPVNSLNNDLAKKSEKVLLSNNLLNKTDTLFIKYSIKKVDSCNEYLKIDEAYLNGKKGIVRKTRDYDMVIELK